MSNVDNKLAKPVMKDMILHGAELSLLPSGITSVATFAFLKAVIADHMARTRRPFFKPATRSAFATSLRIPDGAQIWIGHFRKGDSITGLLYTQYLHTKGGPLKGFEFYVFTYVIGHVALQVVSPRWTKPVRRRPPFPILEASDWETRAVQLWPSNVLSVLWPPPKQIDRVAFVQFRNRWARLVVRI